MRQNVVDVGSLLRYNNFMRDTKHLEKFAKEREQREKEAKLFKSQKKAVEAGANGTLKYSIKEGTNKDKIADQKILKKIN